MRNCFEGYLIPDCATPFPIMHCSSFARMYNAEQNKEEDK